MDADRDGRNDRRLSLALSPHRKGDAPAGRFRADERRDEEAWRQPRILDVPDRRIGRLSARLETAADGRCGPDRADGLRLHRPRLPVGCVGGRTEEPTSELQSLMRIQYA